MPKPKDNYIVYELGHSIPKTKSIQNQWFKHAGINRPKEEYVVPFLQAIKTVEAEKETKANANLEE